jgi:hypothetical protein
VLLEHTMTLELRELGYVEKVFPIFVGELHGDNYDRFCAWPLFTSDVMVSAVEDKLVSHMTEQGVGTPVRANRSVQAVWTEITKCQGAFLEGKNDVSLTKAVELIAHMAAHSAVDGGGGDLTGQTSVSKLRTTVQRDNIATVTTTAALEADSLSQRCEQLRLENDALKAEMKVLKARLLN